MSLKIKTRCNMFKLLCSFLTKHSLFTLTTRFVPIFILFLLMSTPNLNAQRDLLDKKKSTTCLNRSFTVMVHMLRDTFSDINANPQDIRDAVELVNIWFEPICVDFHIEQIDTIDNFQYNVPESDNELEQLWNYHNEDYRINLYVVKDLSKITDELVFATPDGILETNFGGVIITKMAAAEDPLWLVHGFGHYCGLLNTNTDFGTELVNGDNCEIAGDQICDTPADPHDPSTPDNGLDLYYNMECRFIFLPKDPNNEYYVPQTGNAMSNYPTFCWCGLTFDQFEKMASLIRNSPLFD